MNYADNLRIDKSVPNSEMKDVGFVIIYAFDTKNNEIEPDQLSIALQNKQVKSAIVDMRDLQPKKINVTHLWGGYTGIKDKKGNDVYDHLIKLNKSQINLLNEKGDFSLQMGKKDMVFPMLACRCPMGEAMTSTDVLKMREWKRNGKIPEEKPSVQIAGLLPKFWVKEKFEKTFAEVTPQALEKLKEIEKKYEIKIRRKNKKMAKKLELEYENELEYGD